MTYDPYGLPATLLFSWHHLVKTEVQSVSPKLLRSASTLIDLECGYRSIGSNWFLGSPTETHPLPLSPHVERHAISTKLRFAQPTSQKDDGDKAFAQGNSGPQTKIDRFGAGFGVVKRIMGSICKIRRFRNFIPASLSSAFSGN